MINYCYEDWPYNLSAIRYDQCRILCLRVDVLWEKANGKLGGAGSVLSDARCQFMQTVGQERGGERCKKRNAG